MAVAGSSFRRNPIPSASSWSTAPVVVTSLGIKRGPNAMAYISTDIPDLDVILGGVFLLGNMVMIMEDTEAPHHLLLLRNFMAQGLVHCQLLLFSSNVVDLWAFLGTLISPLPLPSSHAVCAKGGGPARAGLDGGPGAATTEGLRIAW